MCEYVHSSSLRNDKKKIKIWDKFSFIPQECVRVSVPEWEMKPVCVPIRLLAAPDKSIKAFECLSPVVLIIAVSHNSTGRSCRLVLSERKDQHPPVTLCLCVCVCQRERERESESEIIAFDHLAVCDWIGSVLKSCFDMAVFCLLLHNSIGSSRWGCSAPDAAFVSSHVTCVWTGWLCQLPASKPVSIIVYNWQIINKSSCVISLKKNTRPNIRCGRPARKCFCFFFHQPVRVFWVALLAQTMKVFSK